MTYQDLQEMTVDERYEYLMNSVMQVVSYLNVLRVSYDATQYVVQSEVDSDNRIIRLEIKCPYDTLAWKLALLLESSTIMQIRIDGNSVYIQ